MESGNGLKRDRSSLRGSKAPVLSAHGLWGLLRAESTENYLVGMRLGVVWRGKIGKGPSWEEEEEEEEWEVWEEEKEEGGREGEEERGEWGRYREGPWECEKRGSFWRQC